MHSLSTEILPGAIREQLQINSKIKPGNLSPQKLFTAPCHLKTAW
jgi:hypothetical protein